MDGFDDRLIAVDEFHHVSANPENRLGAQLAGLMGRDRVHIVAMTGPYFRSDAQPVTYTYYEQLNDYQYLKKLDIGYFFYTGAYVDTILKVLDPNEKNRYSYPVGEFTGKHKG